MKNDTEPPHPIDTDDHNDVFNRWHAKPERRCGDPRLARGQHDTCARHDRNIEHDYDDHPGSRIALTEVRGSTGATEPEGDNTSVSIDVPDGRGYLVTDNGADGKPMTLHSATG